MYNTHPTTGVRYGVISLNSLDPFVVEDLLYGPDAVDTSYKAAYDEARAEADACYDDHLEQAHIAASETDHLMIEADREAFIASWFESKDIEFDREIFVERELERFSDCCQIDEPNYSGEVDGVKYEVSWLGGAMLLWVIEGPIGYAKRLCSPCVPNAADLDGGFVLEDEDNDDFDFECYCVPRDWLLDAA